MMISVDALTWMVSSAIALTVLAPAVLLVIWIIDWLKKRLW